MTRDVGVYLTLRWNDFLRVDLVDEIRTFYIAQVCAFLLIGQIRADTLRHQLTSVRASMSSQ
jgi:hypothetical protein